MKRHICMVTLLISVFTFIYIDEELGSNGVIGAIESVFGGGNAANVEGNTNVLVGTKNSTANITGNVYGGGNNAEVTGNTNVIVGIPPVAGARE